MIPLLGTDVFPCGSSDPVTVEGLEFLAWWGDGMDGMCFPQDAGALVGEGGFTGIFLEVRNFC